MVKSVVPSNMVRQFDHDARRSENPAEREAARSGAEDIRANGYDTTTLRAQTAVSRVSPYVQ